MFLNLIKKQSIFLYNIVQLILEKVFNLIQGIGTDIIEVQRIAKAIERNGNFILKGFTKSEQEYFRIRNNNPHTIAGIFAAKEAVSKALGTGIRGFGLKDIEILHDNLNKPVVKLSLKIIEKYNLKNYRFHLSISHSNENAIAFAILEEEQ